MNVNEQNVTMISKYNLAIMIPSFFLNNQIPNTYNNILFPMIRNDIFRAKFCKVIRFFFYN